MNDVVVKNEKYLKENPLSVVEYPLDQPPVNDRYRQIVCAIEEKGFI